MRRHQSLSGNWSFQLDPHDTLSPDTLEPGRAIPVPLPYQAAFPELRGYSGYSWYARSFELERAWLEGELLLEFGAVDYWCQVFVNGECVGEHEGGFTPFAFSIAAQARPGENRLAVRVYDPVQSELHVPRWPRYDPEAGAGGPPFDARHIPHGKQEWYINVGGIWQDVGLTAVPASYLGAVHVLPELSGRATVRAQLAGQALEAGELTLRLEGQGGPLETRKVLQPGERGVEAALELSAPRLWSPDDPYLYELTVRLETPAGTDERRERFGFREISSGGGRLLLNGEPIFLRSALDQDLYPETIYTVPSEAYLRDQFEKAKALGLNSLRCHIKPPDPRYLELADEMGLLIWAEVPSWRTFVAKGEVHPHQLSLHQDVRARVKATLEDMVRRDFNHPSLVIWSIVNEDWGTSLPLSADDRAWVAEMYRYCKQLDPTRLVVDNSPCPHAWGPNVHVESDIDDFHLYANIPDQANSIEGALEQFALRPLWSYSSRGDARRSGQEPLILSEFGNWGLPSPAHYRAHYGGDPPWFDLGPWWSPWEGEPGWPAGAEERFERLGLNGIWPDYEAFAEATQWHQFEALRFQIEAMRRLPSLAGYVITELTDAYWESNGLLDFQRQPKAFFERFRSFNAPDVVVPQSRRYSFWDDEAVSLRLHVSRYGTRDWGEARLRWEADGGGSGQFGSPEALRGLERGEVRSVGMVRLEPPRVRQARRVPFRLMLEASAGEALAAATFDPLVLSAEDRRPRYEGEVAVIARYGPMRGADLETEAETAPETPQPLTGTPEDAPHVRLEAALRRLGYRTRTALSTDTRLAVSTYPDAELLAWVRAGGDLLFLSRGFSPFFWVQGRGGAYSGSWISSYSWLRPGVHRRLGAPNPLGLPFKDIMPKWTILGLPTEDAAVQGDFLAGMVAGWVRHPAVHTVQFRYGQGRVVMSTFDLEDALPRDPVAVAMLHDLLEHLVSGACQPSLKGNF